MGISINKQSKFVCLAMALIMALGIFLSAGTSVYASEQNKSILSEQEKYQQISEESLTDLFSSIEAIPDSVLNSNDSVEANKYLQNFQTPEVSYRGWWECSLAIGGVLVTTAVPIAKLVKIKRLVKALGGGVQAAKIIFGASLAGEKWAALGGAAKDLVLELAGVTSVKKACFG